MGVLVSGSNVDVYQANSDWTNSGSKGVQVVPIEGTDSRATVTTPNDVNTCSANSATGMTVCTANNTDVYIIKGSKVVTTVTSGSDAKANFSGGFCNNCEVVVDSTTNRAFLGMGLSTGAAPANPTGYQILDLATDTFGAPIPSQAAIATGAGLTGGISEGIAVDPVRHLILSPDEWSLYEVVKTTPPIGVFDSQLPSEAGLDSAAEDCTTGIAISGVEFASLVYITDLTQATFKSGAAGSAGTWTAPGRLQSLSPDFSALGAGICGIAVAPGTHLAIATSEGGFGVNAIGVIELPSTSGSGKPAVVDFIVAHLPNAPDGAPFYYGDDPHNMTAYVSPVSNQAFGLIGDFSFPHKYIAVVDLQGLLGAPRTPGTHTVDPSVNLITKGIVRYVPVS